MLLQLFEALEFPLLGAFFRGKKTTAFLMACGASMTLPHARESICSAMMRYAYKNWILTYVLIVSIAQTLRTFLDLQHRLFIHRTQRCLFYPLSNAATLMVSPLIMQCPILLEPALPWDFILPWTIARNRRRAATFGAINVDAPGASHFPSFVQTVGLSATQKTSGWSPVLPTSTRNLKNTIWQSAPFQKIITSIHFYLFAHAKVFRSLSAHLKTSKLYK